MMMLQLISVHAGRTHYPVKQRNEPSNQDILLFMVVSIEKDSYKLLEKDSYTKTCRLPKTERGLPNRDVPQTRKIQYFPTRLIYFIPLHMLQIHNPLNKTNSYLPCKVPLLKYDQEKGFIHQMGMNNWKNKRQSIWEKEKGAGWEGRNKETKCEI